MRVGIVHPGAMGSALGAAAGSVCWAGEGRSQATRRRAGAAAFEDAGSLVALVASADVIVSVCPPDAAEDVAKSVSTAGFAGIFVDANAVSPAITVRISSLFKRFVDGGIIGPPPTGAGTTRLYLAGGEAATVAAIWEGSAVDCRVLSARVGTASALKMAYAGWTKGSTALLLAMRAYAEATGVGPELLAEFEMSIPELPERLEATGGRVGGKAWRFAGEMVEIAAALRDEGLPSGFHVAATDVYARLAALKGQDATSLDDVLALLGRDGD